MTTDRIQAVQGRRRSNAAGPHGSTPTRAAQLADALTDWAGEHDIPTRRTTDMAEGTTRASLYSDELRIVTRTWGYGPAAEYQADLLARDLHKAGNYTPVVHLNHCDPEELRAFARALLAVADETEHQYEED